MPRPASPEKQRELDELARVLRVLAGFKRPLGDESVGKMFVDAVEKTVRDGSLTGMRMMYNDLVEAAQGYGPDQLRQLDRLLQDQAGVSLEQIFEKRNARIRKIRERGRITTDEQYYLVREYFEFIWDDPSRAEDAQALQSLMSAYEDRKARGAPRKSPGASP